MLATGLGLMWQANGYTTMSTPIYETCEYEKILVLWLFYLYGTTDLKYGDYLVSLISSYKLHPLLKHNVSHSSKQKCKPKSSMDKKDSTFWF
jgi:hypothetical protein